MSALETRYQPESAIGYRQRSGSGPSLVMLHGIGSDAGSFDRLLDYLPADWNMVAWHAPGYGNSKPVTDPAPDAAEYSERLAAFVAALNIGPMVLVGHSLGTLMAAEFVARHADTVSGLVLMACAQGYGIEQGQELPPKAAERLATLDRLGPEEFAAQRAPRLMAQPDSQPEILADAIAAMSRIDPSGYRQAVYALSRGDLAGRVAGLSVASLVLVGLLDVVTPPEQSRWAHEALSRSAPDFAHDWVGIEGAGHIVHQQRPVEVASALGNFVSRIQPQLERA